MAIKAYKSHRRIRCLGGNTKVHGISIPEYIMRDLKKDFDLEKTYFQVSYCNKQIMITSGCQPGVVQNDNDE